MHSVRNSHALSSLQVSPREASSLETGGAKLCIVGPRSLLRHKSHPKYFQKVFMYFLQPKVFLSMSSFFTCISTCKCFLLIIITHLVGK